MRLKAWLCWWLWLVAVKDMGTSAAKPKLNIADFVYMNETSSFRRYGTIVNVECSPPAGDACDGMFELICNNDQVIDSKPCSKAEDGAHFRVPLNNTALGQCYCKYKKETSKEILDLSKHLCSSTTPNLPETCPPDEQFCKVEGDQATASCTKRDPKMCVEEGKSKGQTCPGGRNSACDSAMKNDAKKPQVMIPRSSSCPADHDVPNVRLNGEVKYLDQEAVTDMTKDPTTRIAVNAAAKELLNAQVELIITSTEGEELFKDQKKNEGTGVVFNIDNNIFKGKTGRYMVKVEIVKEKSNEEPTTMMFFLIVHMTDVEVEITKTKNAAGETVLTAGSDFKIPEGFLAEFEWFKDGVFIGKGPTMKPDGPGRYTVKHHLVYIGTNPFMRTPVGSQVSAEENVEDTNVPPTGDATPITKKNGTPEKPPKPPTPPPAAEWEWWHTFLIVIGVLVFGVIGLIVGIVWIRRSRRETEDEEMGQQVPKPMTDKKLKKADVPVVMSLPKAEGAIKGPDLEKWMEKRNEIAADPEKPDPEMDKFEADAKEDEKQVAKVEPEFSRVASGIRADTSVTCDIPKVFSGEMQDIWTTLPMNRMYDADEYLWLLTDAPSSNIEAYKVCRVAQQYKVGVVVWVGTLKPKKIFRYMPLTEGDIEELEGRLGYGKIVIKATIVIVHLWGKVVHQEMRYYKNKDQYEVVRHVTLVHIDHWEDHEAPMNTGWVADAVVIICAEHKIQAGRGLPAMLIHCSATLHRSIIVSNAMINNNMLKKHKTANPMGTLKYIRRHRYLAMSSNTVSDKRVLKTHMKTLAEILVHLWRKYASSPKSAKEKSQPKKVHKV